MPNYEENEGPEEPAELAAIREARDAIEDAQRKFLRRYGWKYTCNIPGSFWMWRRDFSDVDAKRLEWWEQSSGKPSKPKPYGVITAGPDLAVSITMAEISYGNLPEEQ